MDTKLLKYFPSEYLKIYKSLDKEKYRYIEYEDDDNVVYFILMHDNNIVGVLKEKYIFGYKYKGCVVENKRTLMYITINADYRNKGYATKLLNDYFLYLVENNYNNLYLSPYSKMGYYYLRGIFYQLSEKYKIELIDKDYCYES